MERHQVRCSVLSVSFLNVVSRHRVELADLASHANPSSTRLGAFSRSTLVKTVENATPLFLVLAFVNEVSSKTLELWEYVSQITTFCFILHFVSRVLLAMKHLALIECDAVAGATNFNDQAQPKLQKLEAQVKDFFSDL